MADTGHCIVGYNDEARVSDYEGLFEGGACPVCRFGLGPRTARNIDLASLPNGSVCALGGCYPILLIYARDFVAALTDSERGAFSMREVSANGVATDYVELVARETVAVTGVKGAEYPTAFQQSWTCSRCGRVKFVVEKAGYPYDSVFVSADAIPETHLFVIDDGWRDRIALVWSRSPAFVAAAPDIVLDPIVALPPAEAELPSPPVESEFDWVF